MFIKDITPEMLKMHIQKFCVMTGMEYVDLIEIIFPMAIQKYGKWHISLLNRAFDDFITSGKKTPSRFAFNFICGVLNDYLSSYHSEIPKFENIIPYVPKLPSPQDEERIFQTNLNDLEKKWKEVWFEKKLNTLPLMVMSITWNNLVKRGLEIRFDVDELATMMDWLMEFEKRSIERLRTQSTSPKTKTIYDTLQTVIDSNKSMVMYEGAANFALYVNSKQFK